MLCIPFLQSILDDAVKRLGEVTKDTSRYEQVLRGLITQVRLNSLCGKEISAVLKKAA